MSMDFKKTTRSPGTAGQFPTVKDSHAFPSNMVTGIPRMLALAVYGRAVAWASENKGNNFKILFHYFPHSGQILVEHLLALAST